MTDLVNRREAKLIDAKLNAQLSQLAARIKEKVANSEARMKSSLKYALQAGGLLIEARETVPHGLWLTWFEASEFNFSESTAQRYMRVSSRWAEIEKQAGDGKVSLDELTMTEALDLLADPDRKKAQEVDRALPAPATNHSPGEADSTNGDEAAEEETSTSSNIDESQVENGGEEEAKRDGWLTPSIVLDAAVDVLGTIDLDPASDGQHVPAERHFTRDDDGLDTSNPWQGRVFLNPPASPELIIRFIDRLTFEYAASHVTEAIIVAPAITDSVWFRKLAGFVRAFLAKPRVGDAASISDPLVAIYIGERENIFFESFKQLGDLYQPFRRC